MHPASGRVDGAHFPAIQRRLTHGRARYNASGSKLAYRVAVNRNAYSLIAFETVASFLEFFRPRTGLMQGLRGLCAIGRLLIPLHVQGDTLANVFSRPH